ncbi:hypothetical protein EZV62_007767 [Acer yangbiense]|uniref:Transposase MuDR plant domain-containing protein n=1 Tax=Acer yangbiense TaxID=1000413 RepID=A0A5C7ICF9_9ROSI|nr:hypothetical protein EZV62_007767 [Acer yangbiense]
MGSEIKFFVGQTFGSKEEMRGICKEYAIREGVTLGRIKNDLIRQTYICKSDGYPWRAHGSRTIDKKSFILKTLVDKHDCHRVYNNSEAKVKWIASRVESLVKSNPTVSAKLLSDLLLERYNIAVDMKKLYNVKQRVMSQLRTYHNNCFRLFLSFQAQKQGFLEGCRPFIGLDGCHLKGPCGGVLLSAVALDANSGIFPLVVCICFVQGTNMPTLDLPTQDQYVRCDHVTNNMTEAFNKMLGTHRAQTYSQLLEFIRRIVMRKLQQRSEECDAWKDVLPPRVNVRIVKQVDS